MENETSTNRDDIVAIELPAPEGWKKKFTPKKGGTPKRNEMVFISPTGEEIKHKRELDRYLKSHPGGPSASEFDWGTGDTPRRSARLSEKSKAVETPESEPSKKKQKRSGSKKGSKEKDDDDGEGETTEVKEAAAEETNVSAEIAMEDAEDVGDHNEGKVVNEEAFADKDNVKGTEQKNNEGDMVAEVEASADKDNVEGTEQKNNEGILVAEDEAFADKDNNVKDTEHKTNEGEEVAEEAFAGKDNVEDTEQKTKESTNEMNVEKLKNEEAGDENSHAKEADSENKSLLTPGLEENNEEPEKELAEPEAPSHLPVPSEAASSEQEPETGRDTVPVEADARVDKAGEGDHLDKVTPEELANAEVKPDDDHHKKDEEVGKSMENHSVSCEAPHESKASQVSC